MKIMKWYTLCIFFVVSCVLAVASLESAAFAAFHSCDACVRYTRVACVALAKNAFINSARVWLSCRFLKISNANLFADDRLRVWCSMCMQIWAANDSAAFGSRASSFWWRIEHCPTPPKFLVPEKSGTRMYGTRAKLLVPISGTRNLGRELGSCAMGLTAHLSHNVT